MIQLLFSYGPTVSNRFIGGHFQHSDASNRAFIVIDGLLISSYIISSHYVTKSVKGHAVT